MGKTVGRAAVCPEYGEDIRRLRENPGRTTTGVSFKLFIEDSSNYAFFMHKT